MQTSCCPYLKTVWIVIQSLCLERNNVCLQEIEIEIAEVERHRIKMNQKVDDARAAKAQADQLAEGYAESAITVFSQILSLFLSFLVSVSSLSFLSIYSFSDSLHLFLFV